MPVRPPTPPTPGILFQPLPVDRIMKLLQDKALVPKEQLDLLAEGAHTLAWTVARVTNVDVMEALRGALLDVIANGGTVKDWRNNLKEILVATGWGTSRGHATTIFRTTLATIYEGDRYHEMKKNAFIEYLAFDAINDNRVRDEHLALDGCAWRRDAFPDHFWPPIGYNCRCTVYPVDADDLDRLGLIPQSGSSGDAKLPDGRRISYWDLPRGFRAAPSVDGLTKMTKSLLQSRLARARWATKAATVPTPPPPAPPPSPSPTPPGPGPTKTAKELRKALLDRWAEVKPEIAAWRQQIEDAYARSRDARAAFGRLQIEWINRHPEYSFYRYETEAAVRDAFFAEFPEARALENVWKEVGNTVDDVRRGVLSFRYEMTQELLDLLTEGAPKSTFSVNVNAENLLANGVSEDLINHWLDELERVAQLTGRMGIDDATIGIRQATEGGKIDLRAFYDLVSAGGNRDLCLSSASSKWLDSWDEAKDLTWGGHGVERQAGVAAHEFGHWLEDWLADVHAEVRRFYDQRTAGEGLVRIYPNLPEYARKDRWKDLYTGKDYQGRAYEVLSMAMQYMVTNPGDFAESDPEFFDWLLELLKLAKKEGTP